METALKLRVDVFIVMSDFLNDATTLIRLRSVDRQCRFIAPNPFRIARKRPG